MKPKGGVKLKNTSVDDEEHVITKIITTLTLCLKPEDDLPHPRHLCFRYPFGKSSPKRHCIKCYCYVCEDIAPCKKWKKPSIRHCDASDKDDKWKYEKKLHGNTTMVYHKLTVSASYHLPDGPDVPFRSFGGGLICNRDEEWVIGISMCLHKDIYFDSDCTVPFYIVLLEGLELAWSRGFRYLEVNLGFVFHHSFWSGFTKDVVTKKFRLCVTPFSAINPRLLVILKTVEDYLNREWFIEVKNTELFGEEAGVFTVALMADCEDEAKKIYDFRTHPCLNTEIMSTDMTNMVSEIASYVIDKYAYNASPQEKKYFGLDWP